MDPQELGNVQQNEPDKPLHNLIKNLVNISTTNSSSTVENAQLLDILRLELNLPIQTMSELSVDIYMCTLKRFLKFWPRWDEFDKLMKDNTEQNIREKIILEEYANLKEYLKRIVEITTEQAGPVLKKMKNKENKINTKTKIILPPPVDKGELVMEVSCTRDQLNRLFYRKPHPKTLTIFNITEEPAPSKISLLSEISFKEVLNWPHIKITVILPNFEFIRRSSSFFERTLINRKLPQNFTVEHLPTTLFVNTGAQSSRKNKLRKNVIISFIVQVNKYIQTLQLPTERLNQLVWLFEEIKNDLLLMVNQMTVGCEYQYYMGKYSYVRYLSTDEFAEEKNSNQSVDKLKECINPNDFDLYLEEKISPAVKFEMPKFAVNYKEDMSGRVFNFDYTCIQDATNNWLRFECMWCDAKFDGFLAIYHIVSHMNSQHSSEPDWQCVNCNKTFTMNNLCASRWSHNC